MQGSDYTTEVFIAASPESVYQAITQNIDQWWTELCNPAVQPDDHFEVRFEKGTWWRMLVAASEASRFLAWKVVEANHELENITRKDEWKGTIIEWRIRNKGAGSAVTLTHQGLLPGLECFDICRAGWVYFLGSLKDFLETGTGHPYKAPAE